MGEGSNDEGGCQGSLRSQGPCLVTGVDEIPVVAKPWTDVSLRYPYFRSRSGLSTFRTETKTEVIKDGTLEPTQGRETRSQRLRQFTLLTDVSTHICW